MDFSLPKGVCEGRQHCALCRNRAGGLDFRKFLTPFAFADESKAHFECPQGFKWDEKIEPNPKFVPKVIIPIEQPAPPVPKKEDVERLRKRFEICKTCDKATDGGHKCSLHKSCCFGAWRSRVENKCYIGKW